MAFRLLYDMARIIYALSGQGRGHTSRVIAVSDALRQRGHDVLFCCGGTAREILESQGEAVLPVPPLRQVMEGNEVRLAETMRCNLHEVLNLSETVAQLSEAFLDYRADLLITDFEAFSPRAARRIGLPVLSFNHQQIVTETAYDLPPRHWFHAAITTFAIRMIAPTNPEHILITSFFFPPLKHPERTTLVPPIIRPAVQALTPTRGEHVLVYYNHTDGAGHVLDTLRRVDAPFVVYNFEAPQNAADYPNLQFKEPSLDGFLDDLATSRAVLCTAGFTLTSEALFLGKPLLVVPNRGIFEQTINALFLEAEGLGAAVLDRPVAPRDVETFLKARNAYEARLDARRACGNEAALDCIERVLRKEPPRPFPRPDLPTNGHTDTPVAVPAEKLD